VDIENKTPREPVADQILYSVPQSARVLGLSPRSLWDFVRRGEIRVRRVGTRVLISRRELERFAGRDHCTPQKAPKRPDHDEAGHPVATQSRSKWFGAQDCLKI
jgi:excisionase family DNA binding protein